MASPSSSGFERLFEPKTIAVFGSVKRDKIGHQLITQLSAGGFPGTIVAVNPNAESPPGYPQILGCSDLDQSPSSPDLALVAVPARFAEGVIRSCGEAGVPFAVVFTSGFSETGNSEEEQRLKNTAKSCGVRLIGPNCAGIMDTGSRLYASIEVRALPGKTAFITQSGAVGGAVLALAKTRGIGFSKFVSYGNRVDIGEVELLDYLDTDPGTEVIALYLESLQDGRAFMQAVRRVASRKPVVIIKAGRSVSGLRAASSHTGSLAGSDEIFAAMIRQSGALRVPGIEEMLDLCHGLAALPPMEGSRLAVVTNSGGPGILTSDRAEELGLQVMESPGQLRQRLESFLPAHCAFANPIDLTVEGTREGYRRTLQAVLDSEYDGVIAINVATPFLDSVDLAEGIAEAFAGRRQPKPVAAVFMAGEIVEQGIETLKRKGIPSFPTGERAAFVLSKMREYSCRAAGPADREEDRQRSGEADRGAETQKAVLPFGSGAPVPEPDAVSFLEEQGFSFPAHRYVTAAAQISEAVRGLGFPLVMKVVSPQILHKSDVGGVRLNLGDERQVEEAFADMARRFSAQEFRGVMIYRQVSGGLEVIAGIKQDPTFGPVVLAGAGGVLTELLRDSAVRIAPFSRPEAQEMLSELKISRMLAGYRGSAALDREALAELLVRLSDLAIRYPAVGELDFNPVFVQESGLLIGDVRIITETGQDQESSSSRAALS
ncbi:MAG: acetate--CoA ligase family protein [Spirochaetales bacterium]|nr:acetate--CoA ligase family protein [Spirochaetales bacterium]